MKIEKLDLLRISTNGKPEHFIPPNRSQLLTDVWYDIASNGSRKLQTLLDGNYFDNPKSVSLLKRVLSINVEKDDLILDFFAGSGTTAHAVMELNEEDGGCRKFICVQIPENTKTNEFSTIADICKERIKRVIKNTNPSFGFKVFKLTSSNHRVWTNYDRSDEERLKEQIRLFEIPLISGYRDMDVIYECMIKEGFDLNCNIERIMTTPNTIYKIIDKNHSTYALTRQ